MMSHVQKQQINDRYQRNKFAQSSQPVKVSINHIEEKPATLKELQSLRTHFVKLYRS